MCDFQWGTIECRGDGYCWDADYDGYDPEDLSLPCPQCNTAGYLEQQKEEAESCISYQGYDVGTGVTIWENAVAVALRENLEAARVALAGIGQVGALSEDELQQTQVTWFRYDAQGEPVCMFQ